jgi:hypothetical protein
MERIEIMNLLTKTIKRMDVRYCYDIEGFLVHSIIRYSFHCNIWCISLFTPCWILLMTFPLSFLRFIIT